jgi:hypothetical protein
LNFNPDYQQARKTILNYLLSHGPGRASHKPESIARGIPQYAGLELSRAEEVA